MTHVNWVPTHWGPSHTDLVNAKGRTYLWAEFSLISNGAVSFGLQIVGYSGFMRDSLFRVEGVTRDGKQLMLMGMGGQDPNQPCAYRL